MRAIRRVMFASDLSPASRAAFRKAVELAKASRAALTIVHVRAPVIVTSAGEPTYVDARLWQEADAASRRASQAQLDRLVAAARKGGVRASGLLLQGMPTQRLVQAARARRADVLVLGTHGRTGLRGVLLGSVAARVAATAPCPVLTVRGR
jgi:nucleotide-binding universal stress UspA family protein